ncbi:MAG: SMI1/KNR4 family protein [Jannaschia sp.]
MGLSEDALYVLETVLERRLPPAYRRYLADRNGDDGIDCDFDFRDVPNGRDNTTILHYLYGLRPGQSGHDLWKANLYLRPNLPDGMIGIGGDALGNTLVLSLTGPTYGRVSYLDLDALHLPGDPAPGFSPLASDFDAFLALLDGPLPPRE